MRPFHEHIVWQLSHHGSLAEARIRRPPGGLELRILAAGELVWSRLFPVGSESQCRLVADEIRGDYERDGWQVVTTACLPGYTRDSRWP